MIFAFSVSIFGFVITFRIFNRFITNNLISQSEMTKIGTGYLITVASTTFVVPHHRFALWVAVFLPLLLILLGLMIIAHRRVRAFRDRIRESLSVMLLKMKTGKSFRTALSEVIVESEPSFAVRLSEISNVVVFSQQTSMGSRDPMLSEIIHEFTFIDRHPHMAVRRLVVLRDKIRMEDDFRRKSGQVLARIRAQSFVMTGIYLAVLVFMVLKFGAMANLKVIGLSVCLFSLGAIWIGLGGRRIKWKV